MLAGIFRPLWVNRFLNRYARDARKRVMTEKYGMSLVESLNRDIAKINDEIEKIYSMSIWREDRWGRYLLLEDFCEPEEAGLPVISHTRAMQGTPVAPTRKPVLEKIWLNHNGVHFFDDEGRVYSDLEAYELLRDGVAVYEA
jgi:hypothetical protein